MDGGSQDRSQRGKMNTTPVTMKTMTTIHLTGDTNLPQMLGNNLHWNAIIQTGIEHITQ